MRILLAVDATESSEQAAAFVDRFFSGPQFTITAVNVARTPSPAALGPVPYGGVFAWPAAHTREQEFAAYDQAREHERSKARLVAEDQAPADASVDVVFGEAVEAISRAAEDQDADLIVVGSKDKGFIARLFTGSVSDELARKAPRPVLVVRHES